MQQRTQRSAAVKTIFIEKKTGLGIKELMQQLSFNHEFKSNILRNLDHLNITRSNHF